ncbi:MAG: molybdopterin oxidoreductase, partial [Calditrichaeota bacterium]
MSSIEKKKGIMQEKRYWRSLDQLADTPEFKEFLHREFPERASEMSDPITRRRFLGLMGASMALAGLVSCRRPVEKIVPYVKAPEEVIPGIPDYYATTMPFGTSSFGLLVESHEGRPTKIEGNELHPSSLGKANHFAQASILNLYDPDRSKVVLQKGAQKSWNDFVTFWREQFGQKSKSGGEGLAVLSESYSSPTIARLRKALKKQFPKLQWATYEPVSDENIYEGIRIATGTYYQPVYDFEKAKVVLALDADFLVSESENVIHARGFMKGRVVKSVKDSMNRLYVVESGYSPTGANADHRMALQARQIGAFVAALALELQKQGLSTGLGSALSGYANHHFDQKWLQVVAGDLLQARGQS